MIKDPLLQVNGLRVAVRGRLLKESVTFTAKPGQVVRITGRNGTGKTTLIKTVLGLLPQPAGEINFSIPMALGSTVSYFPQTWGDTLLPWMTAWENIVIGSLNSIAATLGESLVSLASRFFPDLSAIHYLEQVNAKEASELIAKYFNNLNVAELSGGQREKIVLLRSLICQPRILFLDEPYRDLDYESTTALNEYLENFLTLRGSIVYVSHQNVGLPEDETVKMD